MIKIITKLSKEYQAMYPRDKERMVGTRLHSKDKRVHEIKEHLLPWMTDTERGGVKVLDVKVITDKPKKKKVEAE
jgi:hypothetical protein